MRISEFSAEIEEITEASFTGGNVWLVQLWKDKVGPIFQMYHLSYGIGALLSPVIVEPFLRTE